MFSSPMLNRGLANGGLLQKARIGPQRAPFCAISAVFLRLHGAGCLFLLVLVCLEKAPVKLERGKALIVETSSETL